MKNISLVLGTILLIGLSTLSIEAQISEEVKKKTPELPGQIMVDFGFNLVSDNPSATMPYNWFRSKSIGIYFVKPMDFSKKFSLRPGIGVNIDKFGHKDNPYVMAHLEGALVADSLGFIKVEGSVSKNQLAITTIEIPLEIRYNINGNAKKDGMFLAIGGLAALRVESHTKIKYTDTFGHDRKVKDKNDFRQAKMRLGAYGKLGFRSVSVFYKMYFTDMFLSDGPAGTENMKYSTIGISITGL